MKFDQLTDLIYTTNYTLVQQAGKSVNRLLTLRNWLIGYRIQEYELSGIDRAQYGEKLILTLSKCLEAKGVPSCSQTALYSYKLFYKSYPEILPTLSVELDFIKNQGVIAQKILPTLSEKLINKDSNTRLSETIPRVSIDKLLKNIPYSSFAELIRIDDPLKRSFYEIEALRGQWSTRELRRQIVTLYYERSAYSTDKKKLSALVNEKAETLPASNFIRDPYVFEFLNIQPHEALRENNLKNALLDKLQKFLLEMGRGFCFEAREKRILIGEKYFFIDIVLYNRIMKRSILIEVKINEATHGSIGQLNTYLSYFKKHEMHDGDNPPIGILLCTKKDEALIECATADIDNELFVSNLQLGLPGGINELKHFVEQSLHELQDLNEEEE